MCLAGCPEDKPRRGTKRVLQRKMHPASCFTVHPPFPKALHHMGAYGDLWGPTGTFGDLWGSIGTYGARFSNVMPELSISRAV